MMMIKSPYFPTSNCVATFTFTAPDGLYSGIKFKPSTMNRFRWIANGYISTWTDTTVEEVQFPEPMRVSFFALQFTRLTPIRIQPTQWTNLDVMPLREAVLQEKQEAKINSQTQKNKQTIITKGAYQKPVTPLIKNNASMPIAGHGYIASSGVMVSYEEIEQAGANTQNRGWQIEYGQNFQSGMQFPEEQMGLAYYCGLDDVCLMPVTEFPISEDVFPYGLPTSKTPPIGTVNQMMIPNISETVGELYGGPFAVVLPSHPDTFITIYQGSTPPNNTSIDLNLDKGKIRLPHGNGNWDPTISNMFNQLPPNSPVLLVGNINSENSNFSDNANENYAFPIEPYNGTLLPFPSN